MRKSFLLSAGLLGLSLAAANAQTGSMPASPIPPGADTAAAATRSDRSAAPARRPVRRHRTVRRGTGADQPIQPASDADNPPGGAAPADRYPGIPPTNAYQGGAGSPFSPRAANIGPRDTRSVIAPRLPDPNAPGNTPRDYLASARRALASNQTGAAQEALERAQTRILTRSTDPALANQPDDAPVSRAIADARRALAGKDMRGAMMAIDAVLSQ